MIKRWRRFIAGRLELFDPVIGRHPAVAISIPIEAVAATENVPYLAPF